MTGKLVRSMGMLISEYKFNPLILKETLQQKIAPLRIHYTSNAKKRINIIIPEINYQTFYGGYVAKFSLIKKLVQADYAVRVLIIDRCDMDYKGWQESVFNKYDALKDVLGKLEIEYCFDRNRTVKMNPDDTIIATTWWTAHVANKAIKGLNKGKFLYLIQEYEPYTFVMGAYYALAHQSYSFPHVALFSSNFLKDFFKINQIGIYENESAEESESMCFENTIFRFDVSKNRLEKKKVKKLLFYARPEAHASRNMFELGYCALCEAIKNGYFNEEWDFYGIGSNYRSDIPLSLNKVLKMMGKVDLQTYNKIMPEYDIGLALMYTPHPSLLPLEMAAAGQVVVTNSCMNKTREQMEALSQNIICSEPTLEGITNSLGKAVRMSNDVDARLAGTNVKWAFNWDDSFNESIMKNIKKLIDG